MGPTMSVGGVQEASSHGLGAKVVPNQHAGSSNEVVHEGATAGPVPARHQNVGQMIGTGDRGKVLGSIAALDREVEQIGTRLLQFLSTHGRCPVRCRGRCQPDRVDLRYVLVNELPHASKGPGAVDDVPLLAERSDIRVGFSDGPTPSEEAKVVERVVREGKVSHSRRWLQEDRESTLFDREGRIDVLMNAADV